MRNLTQVSRFPSGREDAGFALQVDLSMPHESKLNFSTEEILANVPTCARLIVVRFFFRLGDGVRIPGPD